MLGEAVDQVGGPQIRNIGTIGGNTCNGVTSADSASTLHAWEAIVEITGKKVDLPRHRQKMGMVFQHFNLFPHLTVKKNLELAPTLLKLKDKEAISAKADELLAGGKDGSIYDALLDEVKNGRVEDAQEELDRLMTAGKDKGSIKSKITESVKEEYLAGSDRDREKLEKKLLALEDAEGKPLYEEKNFAQWVSAADKKAEKAKDEKNWWLSLIHI